VQRDGDSERGVAIFDMGGGEGRAEHAPDKMSLLMNRIGEVERPFEERHEPILLAPHVESPDVTEIALRQTTVTPHNAEVLEEILAALIIERDMYLGGLTDQLALLRLVKAGSRTKDLFAIDGLRRLLPDFPDIRTVILGKGSLSVVFTSIFELDRVKRELIEFGYGVEEGRDSRGERKLEAIAPDGGRFCIKRVSATLSDGAEAVERFDANFTRFVEFVAAVAFKHGWKTDTEIVNLNSELKPVLELMMGEAYPRNWLGDNMGVIQRALSEGADLADDGLFAETHRSRMQRAAGIRGDDERTFVLRGSDQYGHIDYITVRTGEEPLATIKFDCEIDMKALKRHLDAIDGRRLFLTQEKEGRESFARMVNKGRSSGFNLRVSARGARKSVILNEEGKAVLQLRNSEGDSTLFVPLSAETMPDAARAMDAIYDELLFYTPTGRSRELGDSGLMQQEYEIVMAFRTLTKLYRFFLEIDDQRRYFELNRETGIGVAGGGALPLSSQEWVIATMKSAAEGAPFHEMVLAVLDVLDRRIDPSDFARYGDTVETQQRARELYGHLKTLKGKFEALKMVYAREGGGE